MNVTQDKTTALVTGAGSGIGRGIAIRLAQSGYQVAVADIHFEKVQETANLIKKNGGVAHPIKADVSKPSDIEAMVNNAVSEFGGLDILVNNAGVSSAGFIEMITDSEMDRVFSVNMYGVMRTTRAATPFLKKSKRGRIINLSSVEGIRGSGLLPIYCATKAGVIGFTRSNAIELARFGITVNAICPGPIQTDMLAPLIADEKKLNQFMKGVPMHRLGQPEDVAAAANFFASEEASFITGNVLVVDGGMTVKSL
jgi:NAD(P)-dependent dehydrogenase (short-subunit alcohol dehydrogenase family)